MAWIAVFMATLIVDVAWTKYMLEAANRNAHKSALWSGAIIVFGAVNVVAYTTNLWLIIPAALGAYVGTYVTVRREKA